jgi:DNA-directed RNA polymerase specialized sigma24 family protein
MGKAAGNVGMARNADSKRQKLECDDSISTEGLAALSLALQGMHEWIYSYVSRNLHEAAPLDRFRDKLMDRLQAAAETNRPQCPEALIEKTVGDLVHDLNRTARRREARLVNGIDFEELIDDRNDIESILIEQARQERAAAVLRGLKDADRELVEKVYGVYGRVVNRNDIAKELGVQRNAIDQRLGRIVEFIRNALR